MAGLIAGGSSGIAYLGDPVGISAYANQQTAMAQNYILALGAASASLQPPVINPVFPTAGNAPLPATTSVPALQPVVWTSPTAPAAFTDVLNIDALLPAPFDESPPTLNFGAAPAPFSDVAPDAPGINLQFDYPDLVVNLPAPPALLTLNISQFGGITIPTIDPTVPVLDVVAPSLVPYTPGALYTSNLLTTVQTSLQSRIANGGTGLAPAVEQAIWDRARERDYRAQADAIADLERMESMGWAFVPGPFLDARIKIITEMGYSAQGTSREVMIKQAELEQENVKHALTTAVEIEGRLIEYTNQVEQRLFESTKYATEAGISIYNAKVQAYVAYLDAYKTKVQIYDAQIRAQLGLVEAYKAQVEAERAKAEVNTALVNQYRAQIEAALSSVEVFKAQIGAIQAKAEIEKIKVETFGAQVQAYGAKINAFTAGVEAYRASIQAEATKQDAFRSAVEAFKAQVEASAKQIDAKISEYRGKLEAYTAAWEAYKAAYSGEAARATAITATNQTAVEAFRAEVTGQTAYNEVLTKQWQVALEQAQRVAEIGVSAAKANAELYINTRSLALDAAKVGAQVSAQLGASALNAIHWSTSVSSSDSVSSSITTSYNYNASI